MKVYEFKCKECGAIENSTQNDAVIQCCSKPMRRKFSFGGVQFKGTGFYKTDNKKVHVKSYDN